MVNQGYIHVYTGNGCAPSLAAFGLALRAVGAGMRVFIGQFLSSDPSAESMALACWAENIRIEQFFVTSFMTDTPPLAESDAAQEGLARVREVFSESSYQLVILDEANTAIQLGLLNIRTLLSTIAHRPPFAEVVVTGHFLQGGRVQATNVLAKCASRYEERLTPEYETPTKAGT